MSQLFNYDMRKRLLETCISTIHLLIYRTIELLIKITLIHSDSDGYLCAHEQAVQQQCGHWFSWEVFNQEGEE